jgi:hypothetical protein
MATGNINEPSGRDKGAWLDGLMISGILCLVGLLFISLLATGCGESAQEERKRVYEEQRQAAAEQEQENAKRAPTAIPTPEPTEAPTPVPRDRSVDIIYTPQGTFSVTFGDVNRDSSGAIIYKTVEVPEGEDPSDIVWVLQSGVVIVSENNAHRVKRLSR